MKMQRPQTSPHFSFLIPHFSFARAFLTFLIFNFSFLVCFAQTSPAEEIETLLSTNAVTYAAAARFSLDASDTKVLSDPNEALRYAAAHNWLPKNAGANDAARLDGVSLLLMRSFGMNGGILYTLTGNAHYAFRELAYKNVIQGRADPAMNVTGERLLFITNRVLSLREEGAATAAEWEQRRLRAEKLAEEIKALLQGRNISDVTAEATDEGVMLRLSNIQFPADSSELPESEKVKLREIAAILKKIPGRRIRIAGHTAQAGTAESRVDLSRRRAQAVASYLVSLRAINASTVRVIGYGGSRPIADNATSEGMAANRRVEILIMEN
jgi:outer membrane protein OmpA-like peptidoglycan-associated protein